MESKSAARYINHSCQPVCRLKMVAENSLLVVALRDLEPGCEVTIDYATFEHERQGARIECKCGSLACRGVVAGFSELPRAQKIRLAPLALPYLTPAVEDEA
jgi:uncharacterized protein